MRFHVSVGTVFCASCLSVVSAAADDIPRRKAGLWSLEHNMQGMRSPMGAIEMCIDEKTDDIMRQSMGDQTQKCEKMSFTRDGAKFRVSSVCKFDQTTTSTEGVFTGSFDSAYRADLHVTYTPPLHNLASADLVIEAKWLGPCKPGQKAGDIVAPGLERMGAGKMNMQELMKMRDQLSKGAQ